MVQKRGEWKQRFKKGGKLGHGVGAFEGGAGTPLQKVAVFSVLFQCQYMCCCRKLIDCLIRVEGLCANQ